MISSENSGFTISDIERYHSGKMLPEEMHALEKAALDDPFLADALEGYAFTSTPTGDIAKIQSRLYEKLNRKKVVPIFHKYRWLSVAAILLVIAGTAWLAYNITGKENQSFTALEKKVPVKDSNSIVASPQNTVDDSSKEKTNSVTTQITTPGKAKIPQKKETEVASALASQKHVNSANEKDVAQNKNSEIVSKAISIPSAKNEVATNNYRLLNAQRNNVTSTKIGSAEPRMNNVSNDAVSNKAFFKQADTNNNLSGRISGISTNDTIKDLNIVLQPLPQDSLKEIVIGYGTQKKQAEKYPRVTIDTLEPAEGYVQFDDYIANNLKMPEELKSKTISGGEVQLSFDVDKEGQPTNIAVVKSLCQKCDEEAIRLLKEGPKWKKKKNKKGRITIKF